MSMNPIQCPSDCTGSCILICNIEVDLFFQGLQNECMNIEIPDKKSAEGALSTSGHQLQTLLEPSAVNRECATADVGSIIRD